MSNILIIKWIVLVAILIVLALIGYYAFIRGVIKDYRLKFCPACKTRLIEGELREVSCDRGQIVYDVDLICPACKKVIRTENRYGIDSGYY